MRITRSLPTSIAAWLLERYRSRLLAKSRPSLESQWIQLSHVSRRGSRRDVAESVDSISETELNGLSCPSAMQTDGTLTTVLSRVTQLLHMALNRVQPATAMPSFNENGDQGNTVFYPDETSEQRIKGISRRLHAELYCTEIKFLLVPDESNDEYMDERLQSRETLLVTIPLQKDAYLGPLSLSQLLQQRMILVNGAAPVQLRITVQPRKFWKHRSLSCLANNICPELQGAGEGQRQHVTIEVSLRTENC